MEPKHDVESRLAEELGGSDGSGAPRLEHEVWQRYEEKKHRRRVVTRTLGVVTLVGVLGVGAAYGAGVAPVEKWGDHFMEVVHAHMFQVHKFLFGEKRAVEMEHRFRHGGQPEQPQESRPRDQESR